MNKSRHYLFMQGVGERPRPGRPGKVEYPAYIQILLKNRTRAFMLLEQLVHQLSDQERTDFNFLFSGSIEEQHE